VSGSDPKAAEGASASQPGRHGERAGSPPLISVVMPVLNAADHLPRCLRSLAGQQERAFEVIVVDGGSGDGSLEQAGQRLSAAAVPHRLITLQGSSIYGAMNHGIGCARGDWLYVLGADDALADDRVFAAMAQALRLAPPRVLVVHGDVWIEDPGYRYGQAWTLPQLLERNLSHQAAFYRRAAIQDLGITYNEAYPLYADWDYNIRLLARGPFQHVPILIASYACGGASSRRQDERFLAEKEARALEACGWRACWQMPPDRFALGCNQRGSEPRPLQRLLNRGLWAGRRRLQWLARLRTRQAAADRAG
jgi:glycosyltransferase involved in cell wall biosynthesis